MPSSLMADGPRTASGRHTFSTAYFDGGCIINDAGAVPTQLDLISNPVYESARTMLRGNLRAFKRWADSSHGTPLLKSYEEVGGKGILRFERHYTLAGGGESVALDMWDGIAPPLLPIATGKLLSGVVYRVTGSIVYMGETITDDTFTAVAGQSAFTGGGEVHQVDGIITTAPAKGFTNEWTLFLSSNCYSDSEASIFKDAAYGDALPFLHNRCHFLSEQLKEIDYADYRWLFDPAFRLSGMLNDDIIVAEAPSAMNHSRGLNGSANGDFFASCELYPRPYVVESVTTEDAGETVVVRLDRVLRHIYPVNEEDPDPRCDRNIIDDFLALQDDETACPRRTGDFAAGISDTSVEGSCQPRLYFTKLPPLAWVDQPTDNDTAGTLDTRCFSEQMIWLEFLLSAICEGFIDVSTADAEECEMRGCFTWENLNFRITPAETGDGHSRWLDLLTPTVPGQKTQCFGPFPNSIMYAKQFNRLVDGVNLLTCVPIPLPINWESKRDSYLNLPFRGADWVDFACGTGTQPEFPTETIAACFVKFEIAPGEVVSLADAGELQSSTGWVAGVASCAPMLSLEVRQIGLIENFKTGWDENGNVQLTVRKDVGHIRLSASDDWKGCLREDLQGMLETRLRVFLAQSTNYFWATDDGPEGNVPITSNYTQTQPHCGEEEGVTTHQNEHTVTEFVCQVLRVWESVDGGNALRFEPPPPKATAMVYLWKPSSLDDESDAENIMCQVGSTSYGGGAYLEIELVEP